MATRNKVVATGFYLTDTKNGTDRIAPLHPKVRVLIRCLPFRFSQVWLQRLIRRPWTRQASSTCGCTTCATAPPAP